jgi:5'(3')-deoxyribonucleotidase
MNLEAVIDVDGIVANFVKGAIEAHKYTGIVYGKPEHMGEFWFNKIMGISVEQFWEPLNHFDFWYNLEFMPDAMEIMGMIEGFFGQENCCFLTSPSKDPMCAAAKQAWIQHHFPRYDRQFLIGSAKQFCTSPWRVLIDDYDENVDKFRKKGRAILVPRLWNRNWRLNTLDHLMEELEKLR